MNRQNYYLYFSFHRVYDGDKNCYLVGVRLEGEAELQENHPLRNKEVFMAIESRPHFRTEEIPFVKVGNEYHTEKPFQVPIAVAVNNFANLQADLIVRNAVVRQILLENLVK